MQIFTKTHEIPHFFKILSQGRIYALSMSVTDIIISRLARSRSTGNLVVFIFNNWVEFLGTM